MLARVGRAPAALGAVVDKLLLCRAVREDPAEARVLRPLAYAAFAACAAMFAITSIVEFRHYALTNDFGEIYQAYHQISHGDWNPENTLDVLPKFWTGHAELYLWVLAPIAYLFPSPLALQFIQDIFGLSACIVAWRWMQSMLYGPVPPLAHRRAFAACSLLVLVLNPWIYWTYGFDIHSESISIAFVVGAAYAFYLRRTWLAFGLALCVLLEGDVTATHLVGLGVTLLIVRWRKPWFGLALVVIGAGWLQLTHVLGAGVQSAFNFNYGYLLYGFVPDPSLPQFHALTVSQVAAGIATHPLQSLAVLRDKWLASYANTAPIGFIGILSPWTLGVALLVLVENQLAFALAYAQPIFQNVPVYIFGSVGFTWMLVRATRASWTRVATAFAVLAALNSVGWAAVWIPQLYPHWVRLSTATASVLDTVRGSVGDDDQVVTTQGIVGAFAGRKYASALWLGARPTNRRTDMVDFIFVPYEGINVESPNRTLGALDVLVNKYHAQIKLADRGVWWLTVSGGDQGIQFQLPAKSASVPAWACPGRLAYADLFGPSDRWASVLRNTRGDVVSRAYWRVPAGNYRAGVEIEGSGPSALEVWDQTLDQPITRTPISPGPRRTVTVDFRALDRGTNDIYKGVGPFRIDAEDPPVHDNLEVRLFSPGRGEIRVYRVSLEPIPA